jgi:hypothetical protein
VLCGGSWPITRTRSGAEDSGHPYPCLSLKQNPPPGTTVVVLGVMDQQTRNVPPNMRKQSVSLFKSVRLTLESKVT